MSTSLWIALAAGLLIIGLVLVRALTHRTREHHWRALPRIGLRHPVVMVHGILGFDKVGLWGVEQQYFRGIWRFFELLGVQATYPRLPMVGSVRERAGVLADSIRELEAPQVILIAHSMGGLDARFALHALGIADRVAALVTIGTPHRGTVLADLSDRAMPRLFRWGLARGGLNTPAIDGLTRAATTEFNSEVFDCDSVAYFSVVATASFRTLVFNPGLWLTYLYVRSQDGANDGLVPAASQRWGTVLEEVEADHWSQIGWTLRFDARRLYERILRELANRGF